MICVLYKNIHYFYVVKYDSASVNTRGCYKDDLVVLAKRQKISRECDAKAVIEVKITRSGVNPTSDKPHDMLNIRCNAVSYTHLDVYKRQLNNRIINTHTH